MQDRQVPNHLVLPDKRTIDGKIPDICQKSIEKSEYNQVKIVVLTPYLHCRKVNKCSVR
jgi:hypothetical protein